MTDSHENADYDLQLRTEFHDQAADKLSTMSESVGILAQGAQDKGTAILQSLRRDTQNLKGIAAGYSYPVINMATQRLEVYLTGLEETNTRIVSDLQFYLDRISDLVERGTQPDPSEAAELLHTLPARFDFNVADVVVKSIEIMVVTPTRVVAKLVGNELAACGYRPVIVHDPLEALAQAVRVPPGMVMASVVMEPINGVELVRVLQLLRPTQSIPMAVLTSMDADKKPLHELSPSTAIIHTGTDFGADFADAIERFNLG